MQINSFIPHRHQRYNSEFRIVVASTSADIRPEREMLQKSIFPELRRRARERGVFMVESDPRWEASMSPGRAEKIIDTRIEELYGYRPMFIGILADDAGQDATEIREPWLRDMRAGHDRLLAARCIEQVIGNPLMEERAFFYILGSHGHEPATGNPATLEDMRRLQRHARTSGFPVRDDISGLDTLSAMILADLLAALDRLHPPGGDLPLLEQLRRPHNLFAASHCRAYVELPHYFDRLDRSAASNSPPLFVTGTPGSGKSALLANWVRYYRTTFPDVPVICHYAGTLATQNDHGSVLRHVMAELRQLCDITDPLPDDTGELVAAFPLWLGRARDRKMIIVIDGLDHMPATSWSLDWLPADIPPGVRLVLSTASDSEAESEILDHLIDREWEELRINPLTLGQQRTIIERMVAETGDDSGSDLLHRFMLGSVVSLPLFLRMSVHQLQKTSTTRERDTLLASRTHEEFFERMFEQLESVYGKTLVRDVLSMIWAAHNGLHETEIRQLTGADASVLAALLGAIDHYLLNRNEFLTLIHESVRRGVEHRYLQSANDQRQTHLRLANYFTAQPCSLRRAGEEPWHWNSAGDTAHLAACLAHIPMFMLLSTDDRRHELHEYWAQVKDEALMIASYEQSFADWSTDDPDRHEHVAVAERLGIFFTASGLPQVAENYLRLALGLKREIYGEHHIETAGTFYQLAELLRQDGRFDEAYEHYRSALEILEKSPQPLLLAQVLSDLGLLHRDWGRHQSALPYYLRAVELKEQVCGADHPSTAESLNDLALLYQDLLDLTKAIPLYRRALDIGERHLGPNHPDIATTLNNLAGACRSSGNLDEAETHYRRALIIRERILGRDHHLTMITVANIASLLQAQKNFPEARTMFERAIESITARFGEDHLNTISLRTAYAFLLRDSGDFGGAEQALRRNISSARIVLGTSHPLVAACINNLASALRKMNRDDEAAPLYEEAIVIWEISLGPGHSYIAGALQTLGEIYLKQGRLETARDCVERALEIWRKAPSPDTVAVEQLHELLENIHKNS